MSTNLIQIEQKILRIKNRNQFRFVTRMSVCNVGEYGNKYSYAYTSTKFYLDSDDDDGQWQAD